MYFVLNKQCSTSVSVICRYLRTQGVNLLPRGVANIEKRQSRLTDAEAEGAQSLPLEFQHLDQGEQLKVETTQTKTRHKDTRSIDSIDPVILKYVDLFNELGSQGEVAQEKLYPTNFGTVRFDNDNVPSVHGQFDIKEGPDIRDEVDKMFMNTDRSLVQEASSSQQPNAEIHTPSSVVDNDEKHREKAFEELFGKDETDLENADAVTLNEVTHNTSSFSKTRDVPYNDNVGFIDEHFFSDRITHYNNDDNKTHPPHRTTSHSESVDFTRSFDTQDIGSTDDLNFIDHTFFKSSLDVLADNRKSAVEFSDIKSDLEKSFDKLSDDESNSFNQRTDDNLESEITSASPNFSNHHQASNIALNYLNIDPSTLPPSKVNGQQIEKKKRIPLTTESAPKTAYDFVLKKRKELHDNEFGLGEGNESSGSSSYQKVMSLVRERNKHTYTKQEMLSLLKRSIIYNQNDIVGLYKPYGVTMHEGSEGPFHVLSEFIPALAKYIKAEQLFAVHRLDATTTGVLLLACTTSMADTLKKMFKEKQIKKTYWAITKGIPSPLQGLIDIPIAEGTIDKRHRMTLRPDVTGLRGSPDKSHLAITGFKVISRCYNSALVELTPQTGVKHQVRIHLGFGLSCPVLGDHKYSHLKKLAPQKLPGDMLERLKIKQSKVRNLPMFLHSRSVLIPEILDGRNVFIKARIPAYFNKTLSLLKLNTHKNQIRYDGERCLDK